MRYRQKPVEIEARQLTSKNRDEIANWCNCVIRRNQNVTEPYVLLKDRNSTMTMILIPGDYVIKDSDGNFHPCKLDTFNATYEKVN